MSSTARPGTRQMMKSPAKATKPVTKGSVRSVAVSKGVQGAKMSAGPTKAALAGIAARSKAKFGKAPSAASVMKTFKGNQAKANALSIKHKSMAAPASPRAQTTPLNPPKPGAGTSNSVRKIGAPDWKPRPSGTASSVAAARASASSPRRSRATSARASLRPAGRSAPSCRRLARGRTRSAPRASAEPSTRTRARVGSTGRSCQGPSSRRPRTPAQLPLLSGLLAIVAMAVVMTPVAPIAVPLAFLAGSLVRRTR